MKVQLFIPCSIDQYYPAVGMNTLKILEKVGCDVSYNENQSCCGQPAHHAGFTKESREVCSKFINDFSGDEIIVAPSGSCVGFIRSNVEKLFDNSAQHNEAKKIQANIYELTEFLTKVVKVEDLGARFEAKVSYHDACGALRDCGTKEGPRKLLQQVKGLDLIEHDECETCCGFGDTFAKNYEAIATGMAHTKVSSAIQTGAEYLISTDMTCLMHLDGYIKKNNLKLKTAHIAEVLSRF